MKDVSELSLSDLREFQVWKFSGNDRSGETRVRPIKKLPVKTTHGALVVCNVSLASGKAVMALLGNLDSANQRLNQHFLTLSFYRSEREVFHLARYHDIDAQERGPAALAKFLGCSVKECFPISWDVRHLVIGAAQALSGVLDEVPKKRLTRAEIIAIAVG